LECKRLRHTVWTSLTRLHSHCTTHRIRVLLISCVVITSLFYPALAFYSSSQPQFLARYSSSLGSLAGSGPQLDIHEVWTGHDALRSREDSVARARCGIDPTLRTERIFAQTETVQPHGALSRSLLTSVAQLERKITTRLLASDLSCLRGLDGDCFVVSPLAFWRNNVQLLNTVTDAEIIDMLELSHNVTPSGIPITPQMVLADRETLDDEKTLDWTSYIALTYYFLETNCADQAGHNAWLRVLREVAGSGVRMDIQSHSPKLLALQVGLSLTTRRLLLIELR
jgi:hypothetical protein